MFLDFLQRLLRRLFGTAAPPIALVGLSPPVFRGGRGASLRGVVQVLACSPTDGSPLAGERLLVANLGAPALIQGSGQEEQILRTDESGLLAVDVQMQAARRTLIAVSLPDDQEGRLTELNRPLLFEGRSGGVSDAIAVSFPPAVTAGQGPTQGTFCAVDFRAEPVAGGRFEVAVILAEDELLTVEAAETEAPGTYTFTLDLDLAGDFVLQVTDLDSRTEGRQGVCVLPGRANALRLLGDQDPRAQEPFDSLRLRARLEDRFGNPLPPTRIAAVDEGGRSLPRCLLNGEAAAFDLRGAGERTIWLRDSDAEIARAVEVRFEPAWLKAPGFAQVGREYVTPIYFSPPPGQSVQETAVQLGYDRQAVSLQDFIPGDRGPGVQVEAVPEEGRLTLRVQREEGFTAEQFPGGVELGRATWLGLNPQAACFSLTADLELPAEPWTYCVEQKDLETACVCLNIIYPRGLTRTFKKARKLAQNFARIVSAEANLADCCPPLELEIRECRVPPREWRQISKERKGGLARITVKRDLDTLAELVEEQVSCRQDGCINLVLYPFSDNAKFYGLMKRTGARQGFGAVDRSNFTLRPNLIAHELGHALGLAHETDKGNLMTNPPRSSSRDYKEGLTAGQCRTIHDNLARYPCST